jgi:hypothetical protein
MHVEATGGEVVDRGLLHAQVEHRKISYALPQRNSDGCDVDRDLS